MFKSQAQRGYIALFSTIILSAVFLLLFSGMFLLATGGMSRVSDTENSLKASSWANTCIEKAFNELRNDPTFSLVSISYSTAEGSCSIENVINHGNQLITFDAVGDFSNYRNVVQVDITYTENLGERLVEIVGWSEGI